MDVEVFSLSALVKAWNQAIKPLEREHVTFYFWQNPHKFKCFRFDLNYNYSNYRLTVDYKEDCIGQWGRDDDQRFSFTAIRLRDYPALPNSITAFQIGRLERSNGGFIAYRIQFFLTFCARG